MEAAHVRGKAHNGSDDWRNGLPLCSTHHAAFDAPLFVIHPDTLTIETNPGVSPSSIGITEKTLAAIHGRPHLEALAWRFAQTKKLWTAKSETAWSKQQERGMSQINLSSDDLRQLAGFAREELLKDFSPIKTIFGHPIDSSIFAYELERYSKGELSAHELSERHITVDGHRTRRIVHLFVEKFFRNIRDVVCGKKGVRAAIA